MLKVFFDKQPLNKGHAVRGIGFYTRNILEELEKFKEIEIVEKEDDADIVHYPYYDFFFNTLKIGKKPTVVTIYDTIPLLYPSYYPPGIKGKVNFLKQKNEIQKADSIITISETSKKDIIRYLDIPAFKIFPIHLASSSQYKNIKDGAWRKLIREKYNLPQVFVLYVGDVNYNKNVVNLAQACKQIEIPLVIVGKQAALNLHEFDSKHKENEQLKILLEKYGNDPLILRLGFVENEDLVKIYNLATVYCQPSLYEGFGLPILEAQACGVPVVANKTQALVEVAGESCVFVNAENMDELSRSLTEVVENKVLSRNLIEKGFNNHKKFSWKETADKTVKVWKQAIK